MSGMVLQREKPIRIWGWAEAGESITVKLGKASATAQAGAKGKWMLTLKAMPAGGPYEMTVTGVAKPLSDIMLGDLWICAGQSNMQMGLNLLNGFHPHRPATRGPEHLARANQPKLRLFCAPRRFTETPDDRFPPQQPDKRGKMPAYITGKWLPCTPENALKGGPWGGFSAVGFYFGLYVQPHTKVTIGLIQAASGGTAAEAWTSATGTAALKNKPICPTAAEALKAVKGTKKAPALNSVNTCYNSVVHPLTPLAIKGILWYQGENNSKDWHYEEKLTTLINDWRRAFDDTTLPFYIVQLCNWKNLAANPTQFPSARDAQLRTHRKVPNTGLVVTMDLFDWEDQNNIHPTNKWEIGRRLSLLARRDCYGETDLVASGPTYKSMTMEKGKATLRFDNLGGGLWCPERFIKGFTVAGENGIFYPARGEIKGDTVVVTCHATKGPKVVRFGWDNFMETNLYNLGGLPAGPFRTDDWKPGTRPIGEVKE
jgi:sialate O-acetylesterase